MGDALVALADKLRRVREFHRNYEYELEKQISSFISVGGDIQLCVYGCHGCAPRTQEKCNHKKEWDKAVEDGKEITRGLEIGSD